TVRAKQIHDVDKHDPPDTMRRTYTGTVRVPRSTPTTTSTSTSTTATTTTTSAPTPSNTPPVAVNESYATDEDVPLTVASPGVLTNDSDAEGESLSARLNTPPGHGAVALHADGSFTYTPSANFNGADAFTYRADDGNSDSNIATVSLTVGAVND